MITSVPPCARSLGMSVVCSNVEFIKVVRREFSFTKTMDPGGPWTNPDPSTFNVSALLPGDILPTPGCGLPFTVNVTGAEANPSGFITITSGLMAIAMALAGIAAVSCPELTNVVVILIKLKLTMEP